MTGVLRLTPTGSEAAGRSSAMVFLDGTIVNVALPRIGKELPATLVGVLEGQVYVTAGYLATLSALLFLFGYASRYLWDFDQSSQTAR